MAKTHGTNVHRIDGKTYVEVDRKAEIGDYVTKDGIISRVLEVSDCFGGCIDIEPYIDEEDGQVDGWVDGYYRVIEPVASEEWPPLTDAIELTANDIRWQPERVIDLLANLARRVSSLEQQLADTQNNVVRHGEELEAVRYGNDEMYLRIKGVEQSTASHRDELNVIDHEKAMIFADIVSLSDRIRKLYITGGAAE